MRVSQANRGMAFEKDIDRSNRQYRDREIAQISKVPTPVKVLKLINGRIRDGFFNQKERELVDYVGTFRGRSIVFDAKSTAEKKRFDLKNVHEHQANYLIRSANFGGVSFLLIQFSKFHRVFLLPIEYFTPYWMEYKHNPDGRKSIPLGDIEQKAVEVTHSYLAPVDYLSAVKKYWSFEEEIHNVRD